MDSSFVNYDGRSVHDMIENLLAMSGDPGAIQRLQDSINAVDQRAQSSIAVVNATIEQLDLDKQDVGNYVENGGGSNNWSLFANGAYVGAFKSGGDNLTKGIRLWGEFDKESNGATINSLIFNSTGKQILHQIYNADTPGWETVATYSADEDTDWISVSVPSGASGTVQYRKKNGRVIVFFGQYTPANDYGGTSASGQDVFTLPAGFRPDKNTFFTLVSGSWEHNFTVCIRGNTGIVQIKSNTGSNISKSVSCYGVIEFTALV